MFEQGDQTNLSLCRSGYTHRSADFDSAANAVMRDAGLFAMFAQNLSGRQLAFGFGFGTPFAHRHVPWCAHVPPGAPGAPCGNGIWDLFGSKLTSAVSGSARVVIAAYISARMKLFLVTLLAISAQAKGQTIVDLAVGNPDLSTLVTALTAGKLTDALSGTGPFTVFAPTNEAFAKVPASTLAHLLDPKNIKELDTILEYHVVSGAAVFSKDLKVFQMVKTLEGEEVKIVKAGRVIVNKATVTSPDNAASNGVVHVIDGVLTPPSASSPTPAPAPHAPTPVPAGNHLWFRSVQCQQFGNKVCQCGDVDAAPRMPASLFSRKNARALKAYTDITLKLYTFPFSNNQTKLELGRCKDIGYPASAGGRQGIVWAPGALMTGICAQQCHCTYPACPDQPDNPKAGTFCSLCGPKFNQPITVNLWNNALNSDDDSLCAAEPRCDWPHGVNSSTPGYEPVWDLN
jgi:uncharacterized surface protein with fasciclin (FAS1) repeats